jgi:hypothetical protein
MLGKPPSKRRNGSAVADRNFVAGLACYLMNEVNIAIETDTIRASDDVEG